MYDWRKQCGSATVMEAQRFRELEQENVRLKCKQAAGMLSLLLQ